MCLKAAAPLLLSPRMLSSPFIKNNKTKLKEGAKLTKPHTQRFAPKFGDTSAVINPHRPYSTLTFPIKLFTAGHVEDLHVDGHEDARVEEPVVLPQLLQSEVASPHLGQSRGLVALGPVGTESLAPPPVH